MTPAMDALFQYAQENMICALLAQEPKYADALRRTEDREGQVRALLDASDWAHLTALMDVQGQCDLYRAQAQFSAGFRLALELTRG